MIDPAFGNWLAGFIDGEGCFIIREHKVSKWVRRTYYSCRFSISVRDDDEAILREIHERLGIGSFYGERPTNGNPKAVFTIHTKSDCARLVEILDEFPLRAKKRRDYEIWREAVLSWISTGTKRVGGAAGHRGNPGRDDWGLIREARETLMAGRAYST